MLHVNFDSYNSYVTDNLYQWDINQKLNITGLPLAEAPEIHFTNANMERAIVRQSTLENGTISVTIPNSLLQEPLPIKAYIGVYEGETFKIIESIKIPVIAKTRPSDYSFVDDGGEIYSYNKLLSIMARFDDVDLDALNNYKVWVSKVENTYTRKETLSDETRAIAGFGADAVPTDVLKFILNHHALIITGDYQGTDTYGSSNPNVLTFDFEPKIIIIMPNVSSNASGVSVFIRNCPVACFLASNYVSIQNVSWSEKSVSWYSIGSGANANYQQNASDRTYHYVAIG